MKKNLKLEAEKLLACEMNDLKGGRKSGSANLGCDTCNKECQSCKSGGQ